MTPLNDELPKRTRQGVLSLNKAWERARTLLLIGEEMNFNGEMLQCLQDGEPAMVENFEPSSEVPPLW